MSVREEAVGWTGAVVCVAALAAFTAWFWAEDRRLPARASAHELADNRLFDGAPPTIPHAVEALARQDCLDCHLHGDARAGDAVAKATPHPELQRCVQCHLASTTIATFRPSGYVPPAPYATGLLGQPLGPPLIPHPLTMRENCVGCHGPGGEAAIRTSHPERDRCEQCHLPAHEGWPGPRPTAR